MTKRRKAALILLLILSIVVSNAISYQMAFWRLTQYAERANAAIYDLSKRCPPEYVREKKSGTGWGWAVY